MFELFLQEIFSVWMYEEIMKIIIQKKEIIGDIIEINISSNVFLDSTEPVTANPTVGTTKHLSADSNVCAEGGKETDLGVTGEGQKPKYLKSTKMKDLTTKKDFVDAVTNRAKEKKGNGRGRKFRKFTPDFKARVQALKARGKTSLEVAEELWAELELVNMCWQ